ncbi:MAG: Poly-beta-1,6-N-acetyl-D-glucosamine synthase [Chlamydiia bacterium]|nr:Poly-beta-1,6-N-acetyl-D-glucosamine synthase [Chlamydiia bacterium]MCH9615673.1 Poly-beta-1,6-N-acetyl-D-glucosamine synthase [Chlamydiia bacterium]MCH9628924.1 Poly-beta-1,6-N-acetyl-D-glucosamine synthase [Chlamydiia bacterium]
MITTLIQAIDYLGLYYFFFINIFYLVLIVVSYPTIIKRFKELNVEDIDRLLKSESLPPISIIVPVHNEERTVIDTIYSILRLSYPIKQLILVNDGSTDTTFTNVQKAFKLLQVPNIHPSRLKTAEVKGVYVSERTPNLIVIDKYHGGKADSLNAGLNLSTYPLFLSVDGDTLIEEDALIRMIRPFVTEKGIVAQGGTVRVINGLTLRRGKVVHSGERTPFIVGVQIVEYLRAFLYGRLGWNHFGGNLIVSGAFGLFTKDDVIEAGGYHCRVGEDLELTVQLTKLNRIKRRKKVTQFLPDPVAWTRAPANLATLGRQRERWHRALIETIVRHFDICFNPKFGKTGFFAFPYMVICEMIQPIVEIIVYVCIVASISLKLLDLEFFVIFFIATWGIHTLLTIMAIVMEITTFQRYGRLRDIGKMTFYAFAENFGYRQFCLWWRLKAFWHYFQENKAWQADPINENI